jgi:hypothetical protein
LVAELEKEETLDGEKVRRIAQECTEDVEPAS